MGKFAELYFGLFKEAIRKDISHTNFPLRLWVYCTERREKFAISRHGIYFI